MKKRLNSSILAATSLTAITVQHQAEASTLVPTEAQLSTLSPSNQLESSDVTTLDFSNLTPEIVNSLKLVPIDLSKFQNVRNIIWPWFASNLKLTLPINFSTPQNDTYSRLTIIGAGVAPSSDSDFTLNLESLLSQSGKIVLDTKAVPVTELKTGSAVAKIERNVATTAVTVPDTIEAIDTDGVIDANTKTSITLIPSAVTSTDKVPFVGLPVAVIGTNASSLNISAYSIAGQDVAVSGMPNLTNLVIAAGDSIGSLKVTGEATVTTNAASINKVEFTSTAPDQTVVTNMSSTANTVAPTAKESHLASFAGKTELDFSKLDLGTTDATASRIKDIFDGPVPITSIVSMKIGSSVLAAVMAKLSITSLSSFSALKRLDIINATGAYQTTTLASADLPSSLEEFYSSNLVVRKGTLSADLEFDSKFSAATLDLSGLNINGKNLTIAGSFTASSVNTLKLNPSLLAVSATKNLISAGSGKSIVVSGTTSGALTTTHLQNVGTIDLRTVTGATSFSAPLDVDGNNTNLNTLYLPSAFDVEAAADILSGVDNGEVTVYISGAYSGAKTLDASYDKTILNFSGVTGDGRFQLPAGVRGLVLSNAVKGINVGAAAVVNNFDFSGLTRLRQITDLPTSATVLKLSNSSASSALELNLAALTSLTTLSLGSSKVSQLSLPATAALTNGGGIEHLDLSSVTDLAVLNGLNALLATRAIKQVSFPTNPASTLHVNLVDTITGITFNNLDKVPTVTLDSDYSLGGGTNMWPTVKNKLEKADWSHFFKYIIAPVDQGGINSPSVFDLSGQAIENQTQADAFIAALNELSQGGKSLIQKIIIRIDAATTGAIDLSAIVPTDFTHGSLKIIIDQSTGSTATVSVPSGWTSKTKTYVSLDQVSKTTTASWTNYLNYRFGSLNDKGQGATSLDLSWIDLSAAEWTALMTALMTALNTFSSANVIEAMYLKLVAANTYSSAPAFTTATLSAATSIIVDVTGVKNSSNKQVTVTGLPSATVSLQVEQRVTDASAVDRTTASSWKGYLEHLLSNISGTNYTLDLTASAVNIDIDTQLTALNSALAGLSAESKLKIKNINLKIAPGEREANFTVSTNFTGFTNLASLVVDATGALNNPTQSAVTFSLTNAPSSGFTSAVHVTSLDSVIKNSATSWSYYLAYRLATSGVLLTNLDVSGVSLAGQADLTAFLTALNNQSTNDKSSVQSIKLKLASTYTNSSVDLSAGSISGLTHGSFAVEVDRNGANSAAPVTFTFGTGAGYITSSNTTIKDTAFTSLGSFDGANAHHWLGYVRALLAPITSGTTTLDLSAHSILEMNNAKVAKFITAMNALPTTDKAKIATLKVKLASGDFGAATADLSGLSGFTNLTALVVDRNGARTSATLYNPAVSITGSGTVTVNDPELGTVSSTGETNKWLGYLRFVLNGMSGVANTLDVSAFAIDSANAATAFNNALQALPASEKLKVQTLKLAASAAVTLGTGVSGFTNLTKVIVDQTAAPTASITIATGTVATGEFADATTQKFYVTSAATAQTNNAWAKYIDYALSSVANGGLNQTTFDLTGLTLDSTQVSQFFTGFTSGQKENVTAISLKLATTFGANSLTLPTPTSFTSLIGADAFKIYRNSAANSGTLVSVDYNGWGDSVVQIIDPTAGTVSDQTSAQDWLKYLTGVLNDAASTYVLDLRTRTLSASSHITAFNAALTALDSTLKAKVAELWLTVTAAGELGTSVTGFTNLTKVIVDQTAAPTATITLASGFGTTQKFYVTSAATAQTNNAWAKYVDYAMSSVANGGLNQTAFDLTGLALTNAQVGQFLAGFTSDQKAAATGVSLKLNPTFGASALDLSSYTDFSSLADDSVIIYRNGSSTDGSSAPVTVTYGGSFTDAKVKIIDPTAGAVADQTKAQDWLKYLTGVLNDTGSGYTLDLRTRTLSASSHITAFNAALAALDSALKAKVAELWLTVTAAGELGTSITGFTNLTKVIVDQTAAPTATITLASGFGTTQKFYVTSAATAQTNNAWAKYIDYALSSVANGGLNQTTFDLTGLTLDSTQVGQFFTGFTSGQKENVTAISLKLATAFGANSLTLPTPTSFTSLIGADAFKIYRNSAANSGTLVSVDYNGWGDSVVQIIDPTAGTVADQTKTLDWLKYLSYVTSQAMFDATSGSGAQNGVLDLSSTVLASSGQAAALITALGLLDSGLKAKLKAINVKLATGDFGTGTLALSGDLRSSAGFTNLTKFMVDATGTETNVSGTQKVVDFTGLSTNGSKDMWVTSLASVDYSSANAPASWLAYIHYQIRNNDTNFALDTSAINSGNGLTVTQAGYVFNALAALSATGTNKARLTSVNVKLANTAGAATLTIGQDLHNLDGLTSIIVNATDAMHAGSQVAVDLTEGTFHTNTTTKKAIVSNLSSVDKDSEASWTYFFNTAAMTSIDVSSIALNSAEATAFLAALGTGTTVKADITSVTLKLATAFGENSLTLPVSTGFTHLTGTDAFKIYRNSAANSGTLVSVDYNGWSDSVVQIIDPTATTVADQTSTQAWLEYLSYVTSQSMFDAISGLGAQNGVLDLSSLPLAVTSEAPALISALILLDSSLKAKLKAIHIKFATGALGAGAIALSGDLSSSAGFTNLTKFIVDVTETYENVSATQKTVDFTGLSVDGAKDMWVTKLSSVDYISTNAPASWLAYINYKIRNNDADLVIDTSALNSDGITVTEAGYLFNALEDLSTSTNLNKHRLIAVGIKLDTLSLDGGAATLTVNQDLSSLSGLLALLVNTTEARYAGAQVAVDFSGGIFHANTQLKLALVYKLSAVDKGNINSWKYLFNTSTDIGDQNFWKYYFNVDAMTSVDVSSTTLTSAEATAFFTALNAYSGAGSINTISLKLDPTFGAASLDLSSYTGFTSLANDGVVIYRNSAAHSNAPVSVAYGGSGASFVDDKVKIIDPTAMTVTDTASAQQWLGYLTGVLNDATSGVTLDLSSIAIDDAEAVTAFNAALNSLDSALRNKIALFKLTVTHAADITLGTGTHGFDNLSRIEFTKPNTNTVTFADALSGKRTYLTTLVSVKMDTAADWTRYLNYMLSTTAGGQSTSSLNLNSLTFANQTAVDAFFAGLNTLSGSGLYGNKSALTTLRMKLADGQSAISIGRINNTPTAATGLAAGLQVIVDPGTSTGTAPAGSAANTVQADNLIVLASVAAFSKDHIAYLAEQPSFAGTIDLTALNYTNATDVVAALNLLSDDIKAKIKTINLKLQSGTFGSLSLTLGALTGFTDVTFNIDRNGAIDGVNTYGALVTITNSTTHTVNLTDAEFHNMSTFDKTSSTHWIGYLTHELNSAPENYTLDLTINAALYLDSTSSVGAFSNALRYLPDNLKTRVALLKVRSSTNGDFGATDWNGPGTTERVIPEYAAFDHLNSIVIEYTATGLSMGAYVGSLSTTNKYEYVQSLFDGMDDADWTKYFYYQLNATNVGGLAQTSISINKHLSSTDLTAMSNGLGDAATSKGNLQNLTLNLASNVTGDINVGANALFGLTSVTINTNGSIAKLTPIQNFIEKTSFSSINNVKTNNVNSWAAYLSGQSSIAAIDIREVEIENQAQLTAFLTALNADSRKATVDTIKLKLASSYTGTTDFSGINPTGLNALENDGVEIHRNGSTATALQGGSGSGYITDAKIKLVDLTASSLTNRSNADSWRRYLTSLITTTPIAIDLSADSDTYLRTNTHLTAFMTGLNNLSPANKLLVTSLKLKLASGPGWTNITDLGEGLTGFTNLTSFTADATDATVSGTQVTVAFHADLTTASPAAIVSSLSSVDKDNQNSWTYFFNTGPITSVDVSSITLNSAEATTFFAALGTGVTAKASITSLAMKLDPTFGAASLAFDANNAFDDLTTVTVQRNGAVDSGNPVSITLSNSTATLSIVDQTITDADAVIKTSASSWLSYLTYALAGVATELDLTDDNLVLGTSGQATALSSALDALDSSLKVKVATLKVKAAASVTIGTTLTTASGFTNLTAIELDKSATNTITISTINSTTQIRIANIARVKLDDSADWLAYINYTLRNGTADLDTSAINSGNGLTTAEASHLFDALETLSTSGTNQGNLTSVIVKLANAAGAATLTVDQDLSALSGLTSIIVNATNALHSGAQAAVDFSDGMFHANTTTKKAIVSSLSSVDKDNQNSWTYFFNTGPITSVDVSSITLNSLEATAFLAALGTGVTAKASITSLTMKLDPTFGAASLAFDANNAFNNLATVTVHRNGAVYSGNPVSITLSNSTATLSIVDQTITDADAVIKTIASSWLSYLTYALAGVVTELDLTDDNLVLGTSGQATALSTALDALDSNLKAKVATLKVKAAASVTIGATLTTAGGFSALEVIELDKPAANTITVSIVDDATHFHIADLSNVNRTDYNDWLAYVQYLMRNTLTNDFDLDMTASPLANGELQAFVTALVNISDSVNYPNLLRYPAERANIQKIGLKLAPGAGWSNIANLGNGLTGFSHLTSFTVDATDAYTSGNAQISVTFHSDLSTASPKVFVTTLDSVDKDNATSWEYYLNNVTRSGAAALDLSSLTLSLAELTALDSALNTFSTAADNGAKLSSIHIKVSGAAGAATVTLTANLNAQTAISSADKFIVEVSGFTHDNSQAVVFHVKPVELRISGASDVYRNSAASWGLYLNYVKATNSNAMPATLNLTGSSSLYLRSQADVNALMTAIQARSDKANITTLNVRLAPGSVGSDITFGIGVTGFTPTMIITATGATNNGSLLTASDIHYDGSFTSAIKTVTQDFANTVTDKTVKANWTSYFKYVLSSTAEGGLGHASIVAPALTSAPQLTAMMTALHELPSELKTSIQHLHLDVSHASFNGGLTLSTGVSALSNLQQVTYVRASAQADATAAVSSSFENKLQRLRTAWNSDALTDAAAVGEYLRYVLMDTAMGGAESTFVDLTSQEMNDTIDGYVYTALLALPAELMSRIIELRLKLNTNSGGNYSSITLPNLTTVKYFQTGNAVFVAPTSTQTVTTTRFRASETNVADKTNQAQWTNYIDYVMTSVANGGLGQTTFDLSSTTLTSVQAVPFLTALAAHASKGSITGITLKLASSFGAASLDLSTYTGFAGLSADSVTIHRNAAVDSAAPVTITYGVGAGKFTDANVKIIDPETHTTADKDNTRQEWLEYFTHTINANGFATDGLLTIEPSDKFTAQAQLYLLFDAMEALDPSLKTSVNRIIIDISSITTGKVYLMRTGNDDNPTGLALTGFDNLTNVIYKRAGIDADIGTIVFTNLRGALDTNNKLDLIPTWVRADEPACDAAIEAATQENGDVWNAVRAGNAPALKTALIAGLANGVTFPESDVCDDAVDAAAAAIAVTVDGDVKSTLETALTPFRSTGKIATIGSTLTTVFTNGSTTGLGTLLWLKASWTGYANHTAVMTTVLADSAVTTAIETDGQTVADIKTAVTNYLDNLLLPYGTIASGSAAGSLGKIIFDMNLSSLTNWNNGSSIETRNAFRDALENAIRGLLETAWSWFTPGTISNAVNEIFPAEDGYFPLPTTSGDWDATAIKQELFDRLKGIDNSNVIGFSAIKSSIPNMINGAFTAGNAALTTNTAAWVRPTAGIESDLTTAIEDALSAFNWYTGNAEEQALDAVAAGDVENAVDAATIISAIQEWLTDNVSFPTPESIFAAGVDEVLASVNLEVVGTTVTTDFAGVVETLSRYRVNAAQVVSGDDGGQWTDFLNYQLNPASEGGLNATTLDITGTSSFGNDKKTQFMGALSNLPKAYRERITSIKLAVQDSPFAALDGNGQSFNNNLKIIMDITGRPNTDCLLTNAYKQDGTTPLVSAEVIDVRITNIANVSLQGTTANLIPNNWTNTFEQIAKNGQNDRYNNQLATLKSQLDGITFDSSNKAAAISKTTEAIEKVDQILAIITRMKTFYIYVNDIDSSQDELDALEGIYTTYKDTLDTVLDELDNDRFGDATSAKGTLNATAISDQIDTITSLDLSTASGATDPDILAEAKIMTNYAVSIRTWGYYLNHLKATNTDIENIDLSARDLTQADAPTAQLNVDAFFAALNARSDKATVKNIYLNISGIDGLTINVGSGTSGLSGLKFVVIKRHDNGNSTFAGDDGVDATALAVINSVTNQAGAGAAKLGEEGTVSQWKGYLASLLEDAAHGGAYSGSNPNPIPLNLSAGNLCVDTLQVLQDLETALKELPDYLKARVSAILIKTTGSTADYTDGAAYQFGDAFTTPILTAFNKLKAVVIDASLCAGTKPVFDTNGAFYSESTISKIVY